MSRSTFVFHRACIGAMLLLAATTLSAQDRMWQTLGKVKIDYLNDKQLGYTVTYPTFTPEILALDGKEITITGYIVPMDEGMGFFALSALPFQACFFCGKAGMETVMEIHATKAIAYTQRAVKMRGILTLNDSDLMSHLMYILNDAKIVE